MKKPVYARIDDEIHKKVQQFGEQTGQTVSAAVEHLVSQGLSAVEAQAQAERLRKDLASVKEELQKLRQERSDLLGQLQVCHKNASLALAARSQAELVKSQFEQILLVGVAICGRQECGQTWRLYDVWRRQCPSCGNSAAKLLPQYAPPPTPGENVRDLLAVVGGAAALIGLLNAISGNNQTSQG